MPKSVMPVFKILRLIIIDDFSPGISLCKIIAHFPIIF